MSSAVAVFGDVATSSQAAAARGGCASPPAGLRVAEPPPEPLNESELSWIWAGQRFPPEALRRVDGLPLRVVNPGRPGSGAGPDFRDAVLETGGGLIRGDVELHVRASAFRAHGHDTDPAYDGVVLHVVFRADDGDSTLLSSGASTPVAAFAPWLEGRIQVLQSWLSAGATWTQPCADAVTRLGEDAVRERLRLAGLQRLQARASALAARMAESGAQQALWQALLSQIGVGGDRAGFERLAGCFTHAHAAALVGREDGGAALALALREAAGLADGRPELTAVPRLATPLAATGRPANHPGRRLDGVAALLDRCGGDLNAWLRRTVAEAADAGALAAAFLVPSPRGAALIGPDRARELALNLALPLALADTCSEAMLQGRQAGADEMLSAKALVLAQEMPAAAAYGKTRFLESHLKTAGGRRLVRSAVEQQGLLAYLNDWCSRGGCGHCSLSEERRDAGFNTVSQGR